MFLALVISTPLKRPQDIALMEEPFDMTGEEIGVQVLGFRVLGLGNRVCFLWVMLKSREGSKPMRPKEAPICVICKVYAGDLNPNLEDPK